MRNHSWYQIRTEGTGPAIVYLYGTIGQDWFGDGNSALDFAKELDELGGRDIELHINSGGGDVFEGYAIYSAIKRYSGKVTAYNDGLAASAASFIALAADEYVPAEASFTMIHKAWTFALGNADELRTVCEKLDAIDEQLVGIYDRNSVKDADEIRDAMSAETWLTAEQCVEWGFASRIEDGLKAAASVNREIAKHYAHIPDGVEVVDDQIGVAPSDEADTITDEPTEPIEPSDEQEPVAEVRQEPILRTRAFFGMRSSSS
jgi:ATP-dependent Clp protease protease subunit